MFSVLLVAAGAFLGGATVRMTGVGFALVALPFLLMALGPQDTVGVLLVASGLISVVMLVLWRRGIEWRRVLPLAVWSTVGAVPGSLLLAAAPTRPLEFAIGVAAIATLVGVLRVPRGVLVDTPLVRGAGGFVVGVATSAAALGAAPLAVYARLIAWDPAKLAITVQPVFVVTLIPFMLLRAVFGMSSVPILAVDLTVALVIGALGGIAVGALLSRRVSIRVAERLQFGVALVGSVVAVVRAVLLWNA